MTAAPLTVGVIGAGAMSRPHISGWLAAGARVVVYSLQGSAAIADRYPVEVADSMADLLARCDAVDIVTPSGLHAAVALEAIAAGRHVVCEKPLALAPDDARRVAAAADLAGVHLLTAHVVRFTPAYAALRRAIGRDRVGPVAVARFERTAPAPRDGSWYADPELSGGVVLDLMVHDLDAARWICGEVESVYAVRLAGSSGADALDDGAQAILRHAGGAISTVSATWAPPGTEFRYRFSVAGSRGRLEYDSRSGTGLDVELPGLDATAELRARGRSRPNPYRDEIDHFAAVLRGQADSIVTAGDAVAAVELADACARSILTGAVITMVAPPSSTGTGTEHEPS